MIRALWLVALALVSLSAFAATTPPLTLANLKGPISRICHVAPATSIAQLWAQINACAQTPTPTPTPVPLAKVTGRGFIVRVLGCGKPDIRGETMCETRFDSDPTGNFPVKTTYWLSAPLFFNRKDLVFL